MPQSLVRKAQLLVVRLTSVDDMVFMDGHRIYSWETQVQSEALPP